MDSVVVSLNIGIPAEIVYDDNEAILSAILKKPVTGKIFLDTLGFAGDSSADRVNHGGADKAVCVYCHDHYPYWEKELSRKLAPGAFGENLTVKGFGEDDVCIGDIFCIGEATVQCTQPRQPCHKLNKVFALPELAVHVQQSGYTGYYLRVLKPGRVQAGDKIELLQKGAKEFSISEANRIMYGIDKWNYGKIRKIIALNFLSRSWLETFRKRLKNREIEST
ncbi:MAG: hypothetical protein A3K09_03355 [Nitrospinae bacterium RIFCSPLOWO2_12_FULL_47_7]|nr:MAG: hypothetical protein A3K09_03355 [Nitrospinae bacterium RIFCSPLOWO2_12_FULL_47_7]